LQAILTPGSAV